MGFEPDYDFHALVRMSAEEQLQRTLAVRERDRNGAAGLTALTDAQPAATLVSS